MMRRLTALCRALAAIALVGIGGGHAQARTASDPPPARAAATLSAEGFSVADASAVEDADLRFEVSVPAPAATDVRVTATTSTGTAGESDFFATSSVVEIPAGLTNAGFVVKTKDDTEDEPPETFTVTLSDPEGAAIDDGTATGTIVDRSRVRVDAPTAVEEGGTLRFPVRLDHAAESEVTVGLATEDGTAHAPGDYTARSETQVVIPAGSTRGAGRGHGERDDPRRR
jgi:hypothetical protein